MNKLLLLMLVTGGSWCGYLQAASPLSAILDAGLENVPPTFTGDRLDRWVSFREQVLARRSKVALTAAGPIEYMRRGSGPVVICLHGAFGGYDASYLLGKNLLPRGFSIVAVSRSGYLRTPLSIGESPAEQADAMVALMDHLGIQKAAVLGFSAGSLTAFQMAARHPERIWACVLQGVGALPADFLPDGTYDNLRAVVGDDDLVEALDAGTMFLYFQALRDISLTADLMLSDDLLDGFPGNELKERIDFVRRNPRQRSYLRAFTLSLTPYSSRRQGDYNDIKDNLSIDPWQSWVDADIPQSLTVPVQIVQGVWDGSGNHQEAQTLIAPNIPGCELISVEGCGHFVWLGKNTSAWENLMVAFLKQHQP